MSTQRWTLADRLNLIFIWLKTTWLEKRRWRTRRSSVAEIRIFYGYDLLPSSEEKAFGGIVKIQDLQTAFTNQPQNPNILYLISSALPYYPVRMARLARRAGAKLIVNQNGVAYPGWFGDGWESANKDMRQILHMADVVVYQSKFCKDSADMFIGKRCSQKDQILYNPVDTSVFCPSLSNMSSMNESVTLLLAGSHWSPYRVTTALETLRIVRKNNKNIYLNIAGRFCWKGDEATAHREVLDFAEESGVAQFVSITGAYSQREAPELFNRCSILLHTKYNDPCPRLVVEAMACGLPVVYSATGGVPELVGKKGGIGVPGPLDYYKDHPPSTVELAMAVERVIDNIENYSKAARARAVGKFDVKYWIDRHSEIFKEVLE